MNDKELLSNAKLGTITAAEIEDVARAIQDKSTRRDRYTLIHILGQANATQHENLVASFLAFDEDPMLARIALLTLCSYWGMTRKYLSDVLRFAGGTPADTEDDVRIVALSVLGELCTETPQPNIVQLLLDAFTSPSASPVVRQSAYFALARASGKKPPELPPASRLLNFERDVDTGVLEWANRHL